MIVCSCFGVSDREIRQWVESGRVRSSEELRRHCEAGNDCGSCVFQVNKILKESLRECESEGCEDERRFRSYSGT